MKKLRIYQIHNVCQLHKYLLLRYPDGHYIAINCKVVNTKKLLKKFDKKPNAKTNFVSFRACSFMEYISLKTPFL